ncbi:hypothetical protein PVAND_006770 [Polypedilum vanderplanki]|uniref:C2H2-type domain-containing protein n=1 Tax=Polypedilum vanderplanki TaxID=319348 RepID=A0A9J6C577_POLVA|nr:hypothetical protein PVAND_006770 [Polypedilum vanderplanki]
MLIDTSEYIHRVNGVPLFYYQPYATPPYCDTLMTSKIVPPSTESLSSLTPLTPPLSPNLNSPQFATNGNQSRRGSVIMKVENCQIIPANESPPNLINIDHVCRWENCYKYFNTLEKLANHVSIMHSAAATDNLYYCRWEGCTRTNRGFNARYKMLVHCRTHTKEKPHVCNFPDCGKSFSRAENLKIHIRSHTQERPYRCNFLGCTKAYSNSSDRFKHSRTHQNTKPYFCKVKGCLKRYTDPSSLRKHTKTFNHDSLIQQYEMKNNDVEFDSERQRKINAIYYDDDHPHPPFVENNRDEFYYYNDARDCNSTTQWTDTDKNITVRIETINLNEPLDLSIRHNR